MVLLWALNSQLAGHSFARWVTGACDEGWMPWGLSYSYILLSPGDFSLWSKWRWYGGFCAFRSIPTYWAKYLLKVKVTFERCQAYCEEFRKKYSFFLVAGLFSWKVKAQSSKYNSFHLFSIINYSSTLASASPALPRRGIQGVVFYWLPIACC